MRERCFIVAAIALLLGIAFFFLANPSEEFPMWKKDYLQLMKVCFGLGGVMLLAAFIIGPSKE